MESSVASLTLSFAAESVVEDCPIFYIAQSHITAGVCSLRAICRQRREKFQSSSTVISRTS